MGHYNYYLDLCVDTFVVNDGAVLLRLHEKYKMWNAPGGHIEPGEDVNEAALREVWEEVGLEVTLVGPESWAQHDTDFNTDLVPPLFVNRHRIHETHEHSAFIFIAVASTRDCSPQTTEDTQSAAECIWVTQAELDDMLQNDERFRPDVHRYASAALDLVK